MHFSLKYEQVQQLMRFSSDRDSKQGMQTNEKLRVKNKSLIKEKNQSNKFLYLI
jgi:hypothetical protein